MVSTCSAVAAFGVLRMLNDEAITLFEQQRSAAALRKWHSALEDLRNLARLEQQQEQRQEKEEHKNFFTPLPTASSSCCCSTVTTLQMVSLNKASTGNEDQGGGHIEEQDFGVMLEQGCPDISLSLFVRLFRVGATEAYHHCSDATCLLSAAVLFNMAIAYHVTGLAGNAQKRTVRLQQAFRLYDGAESCLSHLLSSSRSRSTPRREQLQGMLLILAFAVTVNKAHIHAVYWQRPALSLCQERLRGIHQALIVAWQQIPSLLLALLSPQDWNYLKRLVFECTAIPLDQMAAAMA